MIRILGRFCREHIKNICLYAGFVGVFLVVFYLYGIPLEAVRYAFLLTFVWVLVYGGVGFARYYRRHQTILESERKILTELDGLPEPATLIEEDYQKLLRRLYEEKLEVESKGRISRQELVDYYGCGPIRSRRPLRRQGFCFSPGRRKKSRTLPLSGK